MISHTKRRVRQRFSSNKVRCICEHVQEFIYEKPKVMRSTIVNSTCDACGSVYEIRVRNEIRHKNGIFDVTTKHVRITQKAANALMDKTKADAAKTLEKQKPEDPCQIQNQSPQT